MMRILNGGKLGKVSRHNIQLKRKGNNTLLTKGIPGHAYNVFFFKFSVPSSTLIPETLE